MARKPRTKALETGKKPAQPMDVPLHKGESVERAFARVVIQPENKAGAIVAGLGKSFFGETSVPETAKLLREQVKEVQAGDMKAADAMLVAQTASLDALFGWLVQRATENASAGYLQASETYMRLALKAQSQARATWESLSRIKNPPTFVRQANIANGPQQVNNGPTHAGKTGSQPNELNGEFHEPAVDAGEPAANG
jgi:hypothetical protein